MVTANKLKEGLEGRVNRRIEMLTTREAHRLFLADVTLPAKQRSRDEEEVANSLAVLEENLAKIKLILRRVRNNFTYIWEQTNIVAVYLLLGKTISNLETLIILAKKGHTIEIVEIARSGIESLDLAFLFLEESQKDPLSKWFKGGVIENERARKSIHNAVNDGNLQTTKTGSTIPMEDAKRDVYGTYSLYTHSSYMALLDQIDVFHEDIDFERNAGFHYTKKHLHLIHNLAIYILIELKHAFNKTKDQDGFNEADKILKVLGYENATPEEIKGIFEKYA